MNEIFAEKISDSHTIPNVKYIFSIKQQSNTENIQANAENSDLVIIYPDKIKKEAPKNTTDYITIIEPSKILTSDPISNNTLPKEKIIEDTVPNVKEMNSVNQNQENITNPSVNNTSQTLNTNLFTPIQQSAKNISQSGYLAKLKKLRETLYKKQPTNILKIKSVYFNKTDEFNMPKIISELKNNTGQQEINKTRLEEKIEDVNTTISMNIKDEIVTQSNKTDISENSTNTNNAIMTNEVSSFENWKVLDIIPFTIEDALIPAESEVQLKYIPYVKYKSNGFNKKDIEKKLFKKPIPFIKEKHYIKYNAKSNGKMFVKEQVKTPDTLIETRNLDEITLNSKDIFDTYNVHQSNTGIDDNFSNKHYVLESFNPTVINGLLIIGPIPKSLPEMYTREPYMSQLTLPRE